MTTPTRPHRPHRPHWASHMKGKRKERGVMNRTETEFANTILEPRKVAGEIVEYWYESITFKLTDKTPGGKPGIRYTADFAVVLADYTLEFYEVKGTGIATTADLNRVKVAADKFPMRIFVATKQTKKQGGGFKIEEY